MGVAVRAFTTAAGAGRVAGVVFCIVRDVSVVGVKEGGVLAGLLAARGGMRAWLEDSAGVRGDGAPRGFCVPWEWRVRVVARLRWWRRAGVGFLQLGSVLCD